MEKTSHFLVFKLSEKNFALPINQVERVIQAVEITILPGLPEVVLGIINYKGTLLPVFDIRPRFHLSQHEIQPGDYFIIAKTAGRTIALVVDTVIENIEKSSAEIISPGQILAEMPLPLMDRILKMDNGIILIPDLNNILTNPENLDLENALKNIEQ